MNVLEEERVVVEATERPAEAPKDRMHYLHLWGCQYGAEFYITQCKLAVDPDEQAPDDDPRPPCQECVSTAYCVVCGFGPIEW